MTTHEERQRIAAMGNALRPDWNIRSLYTLVTDEETLVKRAYRDLVRAAADCWSDPDTKTPKRLVEPGPWWSTPTSTHSTRVSQPKKPCPRCRWPHEPGEPCERRDPVEHRQGAERQALRDRARAALHATRGDDQ